MGWIESRPDLYARRVAVLAHSRGGRTAIWTGALAFEPYTISAIVIDLNK
jgi:hypothetical protein